MKTGVLFLLLLSIVSSVYSLETTNTTTTSSTLSPKQLKLESVKSSLYSSKTTSRTTGTTKAPKIINTNFLTTKCSTITDYSLTSTNVPFKVTTAMSASMYAVASTRYTKVCTIGTLGCSTVGPILYQTVAPAARYDPFPCKNIEIGIQKPNEEEMEEGEGEVVVASPFQYNKFVINDEMIPHELFHSYTNHTEYIINQKTLISSDQSQSSTTTTETTTTTTTTLPPKTVTTTITTTKVPPLSISTPSCKSPVTVTVTEKETITEKETVTVTVHEKEEKEKKEKKEKEEMKLPMKGCASRWAQCGGKNFEGPTCCDSGSHCHKISEYYSQCM
eukprot:jgi/Orpsp1_1/1176160/evm.model.c7180000056605.1